MNIPEKNIERLLLYRVLLLELEARGRKYIHSYEIAELANNTSSQVRRDIMGSGYSGIPTKGYEISKLINRIKEKLNLDAQIMMALVGIGNLGSAILSFFRERQTRFSLVAAFDSDPQKTNRTILGCKTYSTKQILDIIKKENITLGIIATPSNIAQDVTNLLVEADIKGILNFTSNPIKVPDHVKINRIDITLQFEKLAFYSH